MSTRSPLEDPEIWLIWSSLTEILFEDAIKQANELDDFFRTEGRLIGPLHGVPMTLKDQFDVAGYDSTLGYVGRAFKPAAQDCVLVSLLKQMGAIIIAKSNLPQSIMVRHTTSFQTRGRYNPFFPGPG